MVYCLDELKRKAKREKRKLTVKDFDDLIAFIQRSPYAWAGRVAQEIREIKQNGTGPTRSEHIRMYVDIHHRVDTGWGVFDNYAEGLKQQVDESLSADKAAKETPVVIKSDTPAEPTASIGFVRVRRRDLKRKSPLGASYALSFDLVRSVKVNGKPRHELLTYLGSQKNVENPYKLAIFWSRVEKLLEQRGLNDDQQQRLRSEMIRKGAKVAPGALAKPFARSAFSDARRRGRRR
jgi:hypothetical protein